VRIFILSWYFPPVNSIGAIRVGKFARFLIERGHDVGVVAGRYWELPETLPLGVPLQRVAYAKSVRVNALPATAARQLKRLVGRSSPSQANSASAPPGKTASEAPRQPSPLHRLSDFYVNLTNIPDHRIGWLPWALSESIRMCKTWRPDLVFASGPPMTALLTAHLLCRRLGLPWIAELRDRWADDPYADALYPPWRLKMDDWLERRVLATASGLVTVTEPWAEFYRHKYGKPVATIYNGYDPADFAHPDPREGEVPPAQLVIGYTGGIYPGRRDPTPLFEAIRSLGDGADLVRVIFCGTDPAHVLPLAERVGVQHLVEVRPAVPYHESIAFQQRSDVLLLMQWNDPREQGNCPGKFFEYIASLRPVLVLGLEDGVPATIIRERSAGFFSNDPPRIAEQLRAWLKEKQDFGRVRRLPESAREGLSRTIQFERMEQFLRKNVQNDG
jgi:hypothetical protein